MLPSPGDDTFWDTEDAKKERERIFTVCETCRRCYSLCPSFHILLDGIDEVDGDVQRLPTEVADRVVDYCYQCKLCYPHCPYVPPHRWAVDFPRLMLRERAIRAKRKGLALEDKLLGAVDFMGKIGTRFATLINWTNQQRLPRLIMEKTVGIASQRDLPRFNRGTFQAWVQGRAKSTLKKKEKDCVIFFHTCFINYHDKTLGMDILHFLESQGMGVKTPAQVCCGMPYLDGGEIQKTLELAEKNLAVLKPLVAQGMKIVVPGPTCGYMLRYEYPYLLGEREDVKSVAGAVMDLCEYLEVQAKEGRWEPAFVTKKWKVLYHVPCHLRAQNIGFQALPLLRRIPGLEILPVELCTGMDGTWGLKSRFFSESQKIAQPLIQEIQKFKPDYVATDCPLAAMQIRQLTGNTPLHPVQILNQALEKLS